ncbi:Iigp1 [Symbiodinium natans]|uniref:Iigp1 protein n=1 Tax=Symbiodinium natans TaxID=878477 RepID=A0A812NFP5_9DINO|nr:Iigp1 [Symbiodinium natans]
MQSFLRPRVLCREGDTDSVSKACSSRRCFASVGWLAVVGTEWSRCMVPMVRPSTMAKCGQPPGLRSQRHSFVASGLERRRKRERVLRRGVAEAAILGGVALVGALTRPKSAPGPSERLVQETQRLRAELEAARKEDLEGKGGTRTRLQKALRRLSNVQAELEAAQDDQDQYPIPGYLEEAASSGKIMMAITGASGVGKSSLVNAFRRLRDSDANAAATGVKETTMEPTMYSFSASEGIFNQRFYRQLRDDEELSAGVRVVLGQVPGQAEGSCAEVLKVCDETVQVRLDAGPVLDIDVKHVVGTALDVVIWDLPGVGTPNFPQATYLRRMGIRYFDVVLLITSSRFTEAELMLAEELRKFEVPYFMVRNKVDIDIASEILREEEALEGDDDEEECELPKEDRKKVTQETINCIKTYFSSEYSVDRVYCVSSRRKLRNKHDFPSCLNAP